eukprot:5699638-Pleurochrysis_carterae.AAC.1
MPRGAGAHMQPAHSTRRPSERARAHAQTERGRDGPVGPRGRRSQAARERTCADGACADGACADASPRAVGRAAPSRSDVRADSCADTPHAY